VRNWWERNLICSTANLTQDETSTGRVVWVAGVCVSHVEGLFEAYTPRSSTISWATFAVTSTISSCS
jgi:hypothetical protein